MESLINSTSALFVHLGQHHHSAYHPLHSVHLDRVGFAYNWFFLVFGGIFFFLSQYTLWFVLHRHPILIVRCPKVFAFDLAMNALNCCIQSAMNLNYFQLLIPCQPLTAITDGFDAAANMASIGRAVLFYTQAVNIGRMKRHPQLDAFMDVVAFFTAPGDYFMNKDLKTIIRTAVEAEDRKLQSGKQPDQKTSCFAYLARQSGPLKCGGHCRYILCTFLWFLVGCTYSLSSTVSVMGSAALDPQLASPLACWVTYVGPFSAILYFVTCLINLTVVVAVWDARDKVGLRDDVAYSILCSICFKFLNGFLILCPLASVSWQYTYSPAAIMDPIVSMTYLLYFALVRSRYDATSSVATTRLETFLDDDIAIGTFEVRRAIMYMRGPNQFRRMNTLMEKYWNTVIGKKRILALARQYYIFESLRFLADSDEILESAVIDDQEFVKIYTSYIRCNSDWELNLSQAMRQQYYQLLVKHDLVLPDEEQQVFVITTENEQKKDLGGLPAVSRTVSRLSRLQTHRLHDAEDFDDLLEMLFRIRAEVFGMIDPMIRNDILKHQRVQVKPAVRRNSLLDLVTTSTGLSSREPSPPNNRTQPPAVHQSRVYLAPAEEDVPVSSRKETQFLFSFSQSSRRTVRAVVVRGVSTMDTNKPPPVCTETQEEVSPVLPPSPHVSSHSYSPSLHPSMGKKDNSLSSIVE